MVRGLFGQSYCIPIIIIKLYLFISMSFINIRIEVSKLLSLPDKMFGARINKEMTKKIKFYLQCRFGSVFPCIHHHIHISRIDTDHVVHISTERINKCVVINKSVISLDRCEASSHARFNCHLLTSSKICSSCDHS